MYLFNSTFFAFFTLNIKEKSFQMLEKMAVLQSKIENQLFWLFDIFSIYKLVKTNLWQISLYFFVYWFIMLVNMHSYACKNVDEYRKKY